MPSAADLWIACHGPLSCNSGGHVRSLATALTGRGCRVTVCVPERSAEDGSLPADVGLLTFADAIRGAEAEAPEFLHLWTPRERMRRFLEDVRGRFGAVPHLVHLEDNESLILRQQLGILPHEADDVADGLRPLEVPDHLAHPAHARRLLAEASGVTALIEPLLEGVPAGMPTAVFRPGYDPAFAVPRPEAGHAVRRRLGIAADRRIVTYTGNVHTANAAEVRSLYLAVALANRTGLPMTLIRTGTDHVPLADHGLDELRRHAIELGHVPRADLPDLVHAADVLVQPGRVDEWNACRVPSKLPDFLVSGRPVILPRVNLGRELRHGVDALVLDEATAERLVAAFHEWLPQAQRLADIGAAGRDVAHSRYTWDAAADIVAGFHRRVLEAAG